MFRRLPAAGIALAVSIVLAACGGGTSQAPSSAPSSAPSAEASTEPSAQASTEPSAEPSSGGTGGCEQAAVDADFAAAVTIKDFSMSPSEVSIKVGEAVAWTNDDPASHTATLDEFDCSTDSIATGTTAKLVFTVAGTYAYHCRIHPTMSGYTVVVEP